MKSNLIKPITYSARLVFSTLVLDTFSTHAYVHPRPRPRPQPLNLLHKQIFLSYIFQLPQRGSGDVLEVLLSSLAVEAATMLSKVVETMDVHEVEESARRL